MPDDELLNDPAVARALAGADAAITQREERDKGEKRRSEARLVDDTAEDAQTLLGLVAELKQQRMPRGGNVSQKPQLKLSSPLTLVIKPRLHETECRVVEVAEGASLIRTENIEFSLDDGSQRLVFVARGATLRVTQLSEADRGSTAKRRPGRVTSPRAIKSTR